MNYAVDLVILSRGKANEALEWTRGVLERLGLTLNENRRVSGTPAGEIRLSLLLIRAALHWTDGLEVHWTQPVEEEREPDEAECGRTSGTRQ